ncbi:MAG: hypothetical protein H7A43_12385 [Verrucomicrobia bacterium]|nr:hypothetical protein [Verrucomicrobiota bacterium]
MSQAHDPFRQINYLQQCLSNDKKPLGLFLGAGCPVSVRDGTGKPLIPDIAGITEDVRDLLGKCKDCGPLLKLIEGHFAADERADANVEDMLSHIRALRIVVPPTIRAAAFCGGVPFGYANV